jgi:flagellum-specific peptidoglycan hydrolase FlgJ
LALRNQANIKANAQADQAKAQGNANPNEPTTIVDRIVEAVKQKIQSETSQPSPESMSGVGALPIRDDMFRAAEGGIVSFKEGEQVEGTQKKEPPVPKNVQDFVAQMYPYASQISEKTGIPSHVILGQAGLESAWGTRLPRNPDGSSSNNLFGIKPGTGWKGATTSANTMEEIGGRMTPVNDRFRSYGSPAESMSDWVTLMNTPNYAKAREAIQDPAAFGRELKAAGYATDSAYPEKVLGTINLARRGISSIAPRGNMYRENDGNLPRPSNSENIAAPSNTAPGKVASVAQGGEKPASPPQDRMAMLQEMQKDVLKRYKEDMAEIGQTPAPLTEQERAGMTDREYKRRQEREKPYLEELKALRAAMAPNREALAKEARDRRFDDFFNALGGSRQRGLGGLMGSVGPSAAIAARPYRESMDKISSLEDAQRKLEYLGQKENLERSRGNYEKADEIATAMDKARADVIKENRSRRSEARRIADVEMGGLRQLAMMAMGIDREAGRDRRLESTNQNRIAVADRRRDALRDRLGENGERAYDTAISKIKPEDLYADAFNIQKANPGMSREQALEMALEKRKDFLFNNIIGPARPSSPTAPAAPKPTTPSKQTWEEFLRQP